MRRKVLGVAVAAATLTAFGGVASGGPPTIDERGNFEMLDVDVSPPLTSTRSRPQPVTLRYQGFAGNREGGPPRTERWAIIRLTRGMRVNSGLFARCPLPQRAEELGNDRCPPASRLGGGTAEVQVADSYYPARVTLYNGERRNGRPTLIFRGVIAAGGGEVRSEYNFEIRGARTRPRLVTIMAAEDAQPPAFALSQIDIRIGRTTTARGVRRGYMEAPRRCNGLWHFSTTTGWDDGTTMTSRDSTPCTRAAQAPGARAPSFAGGARAVG
jgi:hypothetical protein